MKWISYGKYKNCPKCKEVNIRVAEYCDNCGYHYDKKEMRKARYKGLVGIIYGLNDLYSLITFDFIKGKWWWRLGTIIVLLGTAFLGYYLKDSKLSIVNSENYKVEYNSTINTYMVNAKDDEVQLNLYIPKKTKKLKVEYYDSLDNVVASNEYEKNQNIIVTTSEKLSHYKICDRDDKETCILVYTFKIDE